MGAIIINKVILMGRLTKDPDLRYTNTGTATCSFTLAVDRKFKQEGQPQADFIQCQAWTKTAEFITKYFAKGRQIALVGRLQTRTWDDTEGKRHYITEVVVEEVFFVDGKKEGNRAAPAAGTTSDEGFYPVDSDDDSLPF